MLRHTGRKGGVGVCMVATPTGRNINLQTLKITTTKSTVWQNFFHPV